MTLTPAQRRLLATAQAADDEHLNAARGAVLRHFQQVTLRDAEKAVKAALSLPAPRRRDALRGALQLVSEATRATRVPPRELLAVMRRAVADRVLNTADLALLSDPSLVFGDTRELQAGAVSKQRAEMNRYWTRETGRFRDDVAATIREGIRKGLEPSGVADLLQERLGVHRSRAVLIAADQLSTAQARAEQSLLRAAGVKKFRWTSMLDRKVRPAHARLEGRVFTWREAPELPGSAVRCRCRATVP